MFFLNLATVACCCVCEHTNALCCVWKGGREPSHHILLQLHTDMATCSLLTFINQAHISKSCTDRPVAVDFEWAGLQDALLLERAVWVVPHYWLLPTSKIPLLPWLQGELPKSVSVYLVALMELLASLVLPWEKKNKKSPPPHPLTEVSAAVALCSDHSLLMPVNELAWPHSTSSTTKKMRWITRAVIMNDETAQHILDDELHRLIRKYRSLI